MHKAFWDLLRSELAEDPPNYRQAFLLLNEIKSELLELLLPQHTKIKQQISEVLDVQLIEQQALAGTLDFQQYAQYVISVMGKICAPVRDEKIASLAQTSDIVDVFKGILETLELMRLDMANFAIDIMRPQILASSVEYEKQKFADYLKFNEGALTLTKQWLKKHYPTDSDAAVDLNKKTSGILNRAYLDLLEWDFPNDRLPETVLIDDKRLLELAKEYKKLNLAGAILLLTYTQAGQDLCSIAEFKQQLKDNTLTLIENYQKEETQELKSFLQAISAKLKQDLAEAVVKYGVRVNNAQFPELESQISELANNDHKILVLLRQRMNQFLLDTISSQTAEPVKIPTGFSTLQKEVTKLAGVFLRLTSYNRSVYDEYYKSIVEEFGK
ncbi:UNVERIFIED_CONTAM: hypothetical protein PYX00_005646 [Menopon gallinae]|uniref:T-complex protein 11-like protein 1 n=1 Tax=Menopon gallinae TaxID=328185 RepID=A0AAW2HSE1_9NEOP